MTKKNIAYIDRRYIGIGPTKTQGRCRDYVRQPNKHTISVIIVLGSTFNTLGWKFTSNQSFPQGWLKSFPCPQDFRCSICSKACIVQTPLGRPIPISTWDQFLAQNISISVLLAMLPRYTLLLLNTPWNHCCETKQTNCHLLAYRLTDTDLKLVRDINGRNVHVVVLDIKSRSKKVSK